GRPWSASASSSSTPRTNRNKSEIQNPKIEEWTSFGFRAWDFGFPPLGGVVVRYQFPKKVVLVTGSSRGMGAAILEAFARAGAVCLLNYFDDPTGQNRKDAEETAERLRKLNSTVHLIEADVSKYESVEAMMKKVV